MVSVAGLAPARTGLKGRVLGLFCIHGRKLFCICRPIYFSSGRTMKVTCPKCRRIVALEDVNISTDLALCRSCGETFAFSELIEEQRDETINLDRPPGGAWFRRDMRGFEIGSTTRSAAAFFLVPFMCVWSGFSLGGIYGGQITKGHFNLTMSLFGIPFILGTLLFGSIAVMTVCGKVCVRVHGNSGVVFTGVGPIGWRRQFEWDGVTSIRITERVGNRGSRSDQITIEGRKRFDFGSGVNAERLDFMVGALRRMRQQHR